MNKLNFSIMKRPSQIKGDNIPSFDELRWAGEGGGGERTAARFERAWKKAEKRAEFERKARFEKGIIESESGTLEKKIEDEIKKREEGMIEKQKTEVKKRASDIQKALDNIIRSPPRDVSFDAWNELQGKLQRINEIIEELKTISSYGELSELSQEVDEIELELESGFGIKIISAVENEENEENREMVDPLADYEPKNVPPSGGAKQIEEGKEEWELSSDGKVRAKQVEAEMTEDEKKEIMDLYDQWQAENPVSNALYKDEVLDFETSGKQSGLYWFVQGQLFERELTKRNQEAKKEADKKAADKAAADKAAADKAAADKAAALAYQFDPTWVFRPIASINSDILKESDWEIWNNTYVQTANAYGLLAIFYGHGDTSTTHSEDFYHNTAKAFSSSGVTKMVGGVSPHDIFMFNIHEKFDAIIQDLEANQDYITSTDFYGNKRPTNFNDTSAWKNANAQIKNLSAINANMKLATYLGIRNRKI